MKPVKVVGIVLLLAVVLIVNLMCLRLYTSCAAFPFF